MTEPGMAEQPAAGQPRRRAAVLGSPIAHSLSPVLHRAAYARLGLAGWSYGRHEVDEATLSGFLAGLDHGQPEGSWAGLSLTMPLKRAVIPLLDEADPTALAVNAVNTLIFRADGSRYGTNTDVSGLAAALRERGATAFGGAAVLGAGATAGSALAALSELVAGPITVYLRNPARLAEFEGWSRISGSTSTRAPGPRRTAPPSSSSWSTPPRPERRTSSPRSCRTVSERSSTCSTIPGRRRWPPRGPSTAGSCSAGRTCSCTRRSGRSS
jgi:hypothetical protein